MERVGDLLEVFEGNELLRRRIAEARAMESWIEIVGTLLSERTRPLRLAGRRLFVLCHGASLRQELSYHKRDIIRKFNAIAGRDAAKELVLLETDANLSSLVKEAELDAARAQARAKKKQAATPDRREPEEEQSEPSADWKIAKSYPRFDGNDVRRKLQEIADGK